MKDVRRGRQRRPPTQRLPPRQRPGAGATQRPRGDGRLWPQGPPPGKRTLVQRCSIEIDAQFQLRHLLRRWRQPAAHGPCPLAEGPAQPGFHPSQESTGLLQERVHCRGLLSHGAPPPPPLGLQTHSSALSWSVACPGSQPLGCAVTWDLNPSPLDANILLFTSLCCTCLLETELNAWIQRSWHQAWQSAMDMDVPSDKLYHQTSWHGSIMRRRG